MGHPCECRFAIWKNGSPLFISVFHFKFMFTQARRAVTQSFGRVTQLSSPVTQVWGWVTQNFGRVTRCSRSWTAGRPGWRGVKRNGGSNWNCFGKPLNFVGRTKRFGPKFSFEIYVGRTDFFVFSLRKKNTTKLFSRVSHDWIRSKRK
jgi:hypothetical protein